MQQLKLWGWGGGKQVKVAGGGGGKQKDAMCKVTWSCAPS